MVHAAGLGDEPRVGGEDTGDIGVELAGIRLEGVGQGHRRGVGTAAPESSYVARFGEADENLSGKGEWVELTQGKNGLTADAGFPSQAEIAIFAAREALENANKTAADIDAVVVSCAYTQRSYPAMAF